MTEEKTTIQDLLNRLRSPLYGNFIASWLVINWEIPYTTLFVSSDTLKGKNKLEAISEIIQKYSCPNFKLLIFPFLITLATITVYPLIYNGIEWIRLKYLVMLKKIKESIEPDLIHISDQLEKTQKELLKIKDESRKECLYNLKTFDKKNQRLFAGTWDIEISSKTLLKKYNNCWYSGNNFRNDDTNIFAIEELVDTDKTEIQFMDTSINIPGGTYNLSITTRFEMYLIYAHMQYDRPYIKLIFRSFGE